MRIGTAISTSVRFPLEKSKYISALYSSRKRKLRDSLIRLVVLCQSLSDGRIKYLRDQQQFLIAIGIFRSTGQMITVRVIYDEVQNENDHGKGGSNNNDPEDAKSHTGVWNKIAKPLRIYYLQMSANIAAGRV